MTPPTVQFIPAAAAGGTELIRFTSAVSSPSNEFNVDHQNLTSESALDGRGLTNSIDIRGSDNPDGFRMWFSDTAERDTALTYFQTFSSLDLSDDTDAILYTVSVSVFDSVRLLFACDTGQNSVWVSGNTYTLIGQ